MADTDAQHIDHGVLLPEESRRRLAQDEDSPYGALDMDVDLPDLTSAGKEETFGEEKPGNEQESEGAEEPSPDQDEAA